MADFNAECIAGQGLTWIRSIVIIVCNRLNCYSVIAGTNCAFQVFSEALDGSVRAENRVSRTGMYPGLSKDIPNKNKKQERKTGKLVAAQQLSESEKHQKSRILVTLLKWRKALHGLERIRPWKLAE